MTDQIKGVQKRLIHFINQHQCNDVLRGDQIEKVLENTRSVYLTSVCDKRGDFGNDYYIRLSSLMGIFC